MLTSNAAAVNLKLIKWRSMCEKQNFFSLTYVFGIRTKWRKHDEKIPPPTGIEIKTNEPRNSRRIEVLNLWFLLTLCMCRNEWVLSTPLIHVTSLLCCIFSRVCNQNDSYYCLLHLGGERGNFISLRFGPFGIIWWMSNFFVYVFFLLTLFHKGMCMRIAQNLHL